MYTVPRRRWPEKPATKQATPQKIGRGRQKKSQKGKKEPAKGGRAD